MLFIKWYVLDWKRITTERLMVKEEKRNAPRLPGKPKKSKLDVKSKQVHLRNVKLISAHSIKVDGFHIELNTLLDNVDTELTKDVVKMFVGLPTKKGTSLICSKCRHYSCNCLNDTSFEKIYPVLKKRQERLDEIQKSMLKPVFFRHEMGSYFQCEEDDEEAEKYFNAPDIVQEILEETKRQCVVGTDFAESCGRFFATHPWASHNEMQLNNNNLCRICKKGCTRRHLAQHDQVAVPASVIQNFINHVFAEQKPPPVAFAMALRSYSPKNIVGSIDEDRTEGKPLITAKELNVLCKLLYGKELPNHVQRIWQCLVTFDPKLVMGGPLAYGQLNNPDILIARCNALFGLYRDSITNKVEISSCANIIIQDFFKLDTNSRHCTPGNRAYYIMIIHGIILMVLGAEFKHQGEAASITALTGNSEDDYGLSLSESEDEDEN